MNSLRIKPHPVIFVILCAALFISRQTFATVTIEDGEDGTANGWAITDDAPAGASIVNSFDTSLNSYVIELNGSGTDNSFQLGGVNANSGWSISEHFYLSLELKPTSSFYFYLYADTTLGKRFLYYDNSSASLGLLGTSTIHNGIGTLPLGQWNTVQRDLAQDLADVEPGNSLIAINGLLVRGSISIDDLLFLNSPHANLPPVADAGADQSTTVGQSINLDGSASIDPDGLIDSYQWLDSDGAIIGSSQYASFTPIVASTQTITLIVTDDDGDTNNDTLVIEVTANSNLPDKIYYELVFNEEFSTTELNSSNWNTALLWGPYLPTNNEQQLYVDSLGMHADFAHTPFTLNGETLKITATPTSTELLPPARPASDSPLWQPNSYSEYNQNYASGSQGEVGFVEGYHESDVEYLSGIITSYGSFSMTHGYVEMRAKLPSGRGLWPAFWLLPQHYVKDVPEIDVMEFLGHNVGTIYHTYHYFEIENNWNLISTPSYESISSDWTKDFHTFGMAWSPTEIIWYVDGAETKRIQDSEFIIPNQAMHLLANLAVGGNWPGSPDESTQFPATFEIDYIRAYKKKLTPELNLAQDYQLMFNDEFTSETLDANKWNTHFLWGPYLTINNEEQYYVDALGSDASGLSPFSISPGPSNEGILSITARESDDSLGFAIPQTLPSSDDSIWSQFETFQRDSTYIPKNYTSGIITSYDAFKFAHGYSEIRAKIPKGDGLWPAFWLLNGYYVNQQPEIDIMEVRGENPAEIVHSYHYHENGELISQSFTSSHANTDDGYSDAFHTYGVRWQPGRIDWYIDGELMNTIEDENVGYQVMYVIANLAVGGNFNYSPVDTSQFPKSLDIDYIRVYQEKSVPE